MNIKRYVNGKPVNETEFKSIEIRSKNAAKILSDIFQRSNLTESDIFKK